MELILKTNWFSWSIMSLIVFCLTFAVKIPIKLITKNIKDDRARELVNICIMLVPLALGVLLNYVYCVVLVGKVFSITAGLEIGAGAMTLYAGWEKITKGKVSKETQATIELAEDVVKDGKVDKKDVSAVKEFYDKVK